MLIRTKRCHEREKLWKLNTYAAKEVGKWTVEKIVQGKVRSNWEILI